MDEEQKILHDAAIAALSKAFTEATGEMTIVTALGCLSNFFAASVVHLFELFGNLPNLQGKIVGKEVERRVQYLKALKNGTSKQKAKG